MRGYFDYGIIHSMDGLLRIFGQMINADAAHEGVSQIITIPDGPDLTEVVKNLLNAALGVVCLISVIMVIIGVFYYMTSQVSPERVQKGKNTILYGIVGLIICLSAFAIVDFVLAGLSGS